MYACLTFLNFLLYENFMTHHLIHSIIQFYYFMSSGFNKEKSGVPSQKTQKEKTHTRNLPKRSLSSVGKSSTSGMGMRSVSVGMLNQVRGHFF